MKRDRGYYRRQRKRTIQRKKAILYGLGGQELVDAWARGAAGRFSKGKIHCSCPLCRSKSYDDPAACDKRAAGRDADMIKEYLREEGSLYDECDPQQTE